MAKAQCTQRAREQGRHTHWMWEFAAYVERKHYKKSGAFAAAYTAAGLSHQGIMARPVPISNVCWDQDPKSVETKHR